MAAFMACAGLLWWGGSPQSAAILQIPDRRMTRRFRENFSGNTRQQWSGAWEVFPADASNASSRAASRMRMCSPRCATPNPAPLGTPQPAGSLAGSFLPGFRRAFLRERSTGNFPQNFLENFLLARQRCVSILPVH